MKHVAIDNKQMPSVGFGTYLISNDKANHLVYEALQKGYRHIDTAEGYQNESEVGEAIRRFGLNNDCTREESLLPLNCGLEILVWGMPLKTYAATIESCERSLRNLGVDYIDLYLIHAPFGGAEGRSEQWRALIELQKQGKLKHIGVSNFSQTHIEELINNGLPKPAANQLELHPWSQKYDLVQYLNEQNITPIAYSSLVPLRLGGLWKDKIVQRRT